MQLRQILAGLDVTAVRGDVDIDVSAVDHDSRAVRPGALFACIPGSTTDGHLHAPAAVEAGAVALLVERPLAAGATEVEVASVRRALGPLASTFHGHPSRAMRCIGVTGTNGKTTTTLLLENVASAAGETPGVVGTLGTRSIAGTSELARTTPEASELQALLAALRDAGTTTVAMEVSSHALDQHRVDGVWFAAVGFTNLSQDHLDYHGTMERYFAAKRALFDPERAGVATTNVDDPFGAQLVTHCEDVGLGVVTYGMRAPGAQIRATEIAWDRAGSRFTLHDARSGDGVEVASPLLGELNVMNLLAAAALARAAGFGLDVVADGLSRPVHVPGRLEAVDAGQDFTVLVDYAHTPDALDAVLRVARSLAGGCRVLAVFGCGGDRDRAKRPEMGRVVGAHADLAVLTSDNPRSEDPAAIAAEVLPGLEANRAQVVVELDRRAAIRAALEVARPGDIVLVAGKGHESGQTAGGATVPFDDRVVAAELLEELACS